ncbi:MAG TPA: outer membrane lipoprotein chaperone LolA [Gammaproteobacteria bacterium]|nr:outer membrane lipoprotein chaperone LolA [Gammaproteobacteria bacterium]
MKRLVLSACLFLLSLPLQAADSGVARMDQFLKNVQSLKADFSQVVLDANGKQVKQSTGTLVIRRPDHFRWDYAMPNAEVIVADGKRLWLYDVELQQVTVKPLDKTLATSPAVLLSGSNDAAKSFTVTDQGEKDGLAWVQLTPKVKDSDFDSVRLGFKGEDVSVMELKDNLGNTTRISFDHIQRNPAVSDDTFHFVPPAGADVLGDAGDDKAHG